MQWINVSAYFLLTCVGLIPVVAMADEGTGVNIEFSGDLVQATCDIHVMPALIIMPTASVGEFIQPGSVSSSYEDFSLNVDNCQT